MCFLGRAGEASRPSLFTITAELIVLACAIGAAPSRATAQAIISRDTTLDLAGSPYEYPGGILVLNDATLTVESGVVIRMGEARSITVADQTPGTLIAADAQFVGIDGALWAGFRVGPLSTPMSVGTLVLTDCAVSSTSSRAIYHYRGYVRLAGCAIRVTQGDGIWCKGELNVEDTVFKGSGLGTALLIQESAHDVAIHRSVVAGFATGISILGPTSHTAVFSNLTVVDNDVAGIDCGVSDPTITHSIFWYNGDDLVGCRASYSCLQDDEPGPGNIPFYPYFVDALNDDYHLLSYSPAIDRGDPTADFSNEPDSGDPEANPALNMGAYGNTDEAAVAGPDLDDNGLPDGWEGLWWSLPSGELAEGDPDSNGISNLGEYLFGRDPTAGGGSDMRIRMVDCWPSTMDANAGDTAEIYYVLDRHAWVDVEVRDAAGAVEDPPVRSLVEDEWRSAGVNVDIWDGSNDIGQPVEEGTYYFEIRTEDPLFDPGAPDEAHRTEWLKQDDTLPEVLYWDKGASDFNPYAGESITVRFELSEAGYMPFVIWVYGSGATIRSFAPFTVGGEDVEVEWDGRDSDGNIYTGPYKVYYYSTTSPVGIPQKSVSVRNARPQLASLQCDAYLIVPAYGQVSTIRYILPQDARVSMVVRDPNDAVFRDLLFEVFQPSGEYTVEWDGRNDEGELVATEGDYTVEVMVAFPDGSATAAYYRTVVAYR